MKRLISKLLLSLSLFFPFVAQSAACSLPPSGELRGEVVLEKNCVFNQGIRVVSSDTRLDCQGSVFDGGGREAIGLLIDGNGDLVKNVVIRNCRFKNFLSSGVRITLTGKRKNREDAYLRAPQNIELSNVVIEDSGRVGIYIDDYVTRVTLIDSTVRDSGSVAVYLEHSTRMNRLIGNRFEHNGYNKAGKARREALAVDSSAENEIRSNVFSQNGLGGIFLYKNCGEKFSTGKSVLRWQHSDKNLIADNTFLDERIGVWVASRQSKNLSNWDCGDAPMLPGKPYYLDFAQGNTIETNRFCGTSIPVRLEDDDNVVRGNLFDASSKGIADIPVTKRGELLGRPPSGNKVEDNRRQRC